MKDGFHIERFPGTLVVQLPVAIFPGHPKPRRTMVRRGFGICPLCFPDYGIVVRVTIVSWITSHRRDACQPAWTGGLEPGVFTLDRARVPTTVPDGEQRRATVARA